MPRKMEAFLLRNFKGLNQGEEPQDIEDGEFQTLDNFYVKNKSLFMRAGLTKLNNNAAGAALYSLQSFKPTTTGVWTVVFGGSGKIYTLDALSNIVAVPRNIVVDYGASTRPWSMHQYGDSMYLARHLAGTLQRTDGSTVGDAGITPPSTAPTVAAATGGTMVAGDYYVTVTFSREDVNGNVFAESNKGPTSAVVTLAANGRITVTAIPTSTNSFVNRRRLYITLVGQTGQFYYAVTVGDNATTTKTIDVIQANLGDALSTDNGVPPPNVIHARIFNERMWLTDGDTMYFSEDGLPESYGSGRNEIEVNKNDGFKINGYQVLNERLIIGKTVGIYYITGEDNSTFQRRQISSEHGCVAHHSMQSTINRCFWLGSDNFYMTDGNTVEPIGDVEIRDFVDGIAAGDYETVTSSLDAKLNLYIVSAISSGSRKLAVYNYKLNNWSTYSYSGSIGAPWAFGNFANSAGLAVTYCIPSVLNTDLYNFGVGAQDGAYDITYTLRTKAFGFGADADLKVARYAQILYSSTAVAESLVFTLRRDDQSAAISTATISTESGYKWKRFSLPNIDTPGHFLDLQMIYTGDTAFIISGLGLDVVNLGRTAPVSAA